MPLLELRGVRKVYRSAGRDVLALDGVSLRLGPGEVTLLVGPSGSGKTTLLSIVGCILRPSDGQVLVDGIDAARLDGGELPGLRARSFGFVFQQDNLLASLTASENVEAALRMKFGRYPGARAEAARLLDLVGLSSRMAHKPRALSGGQGQRVAIARALAGNPPIILADEPTAALDRENALGVAGLLRRLAREEGRTIALVSHDHRLEEYADRTFRLLDGRLGSPGEPGFDATRSLPRGAGGAGRLIPDEAPPSASQRGGPRLRSDSPRVSPIRPGSRPAARRGGNPPGQAVAVASRARGPMMSPAVPPTAPEATTAARGVATPRRPVRARVALACLALGGSTYASWTYHRSAQPVPGQGTVLTQSPGTPAQVSAVGRVEARHGSAGLAFGVPGILSRLHVEEGDWFEEGRVLAEIAGEELAARVEVARHDLAQAKARLAVLLAGSREPQVAEARAEVGQLAVEAENQRRQYRVRERLRARGVASEEELVDLRARAEAGRERLEGARARLELLVAGARPEEVAVADAGVRLAEAKLREATAAYEQSRLVAPRAGRILRILHREGEAVTGRHGEPVLLVADTRALQIRAEVEESQASLLREGLAATAQVAGQPEKIYHGTVARVLDVIGRKQIETEDPLERVDTRILEVVIQLRDSASLRINQRTNVTIHLEDSSPPGPPRPPR